MSRPRDVVIDTRPDEALLASVAVLRHLGARIIRYDVEAGTLEATVRRFRRSALIRLRADADGTGTRLIVESDALGWTPMFRRFRGALLHVIGAAS
jgi:tRNA A22 N-methylase